MKETLKMMLVRKKPVETPVVCAEQLKYDSKLTIDGIEYTGKVGDWLVTTFYSDKKIIEIIPKSEFDKYYEPIPEAYINTKYAPFKVLGDTRINAVYSRY